MSEQRQHIVEQAFTTFKQRGFKLVTMDDISRQVGISKKTLYELFNHKDDLVEAVIQFIIKENACQLAMMVQPGKNALEQNIVMMQFLERFVRGMNPVCFYDLQRYYPKAFQLLLQHRTQFVEQSILANLRQGIAEGLYRSDIDVAIIARYRTESVFLVFQQNLFPDASQDASRVNFQIFIHYLYGLCTPKGHEVLTQYIRQFLTA
ncbi:MAG: TetR/AcrR family transcriptional regulator [Chitinophagaceae bacterium]|nr:TetR/AcrR family transcriptional regulator [Chitinophagaceae bacterium]